MTKQELYEKLGGIYGGQKDLIDDVVNAFNELKKQNDALINALTLTRQKYKNNKAKYKRKAKMYRDRNNKAKELLKLGISLYNGSGSRTALFEVISDTKSILNGEDYE